MARKKPNVIYTTSDDDMARIRDAARAAQRPLPVRSLPAAEQTAHIRRETKGRGGKTVTIIDGLQLSDDDLQALARQLKQACGVGGSLDARAIVIQGDKRPQIVAELQRLGYKTKLVGG